MNKFAKRARAGEIDWRTWRSNISLLLIYGVVGFLLSGGHLVFGLLTILLIAPLYQWKRVEVSSEKNITKPLSKTGKEAMRDHLVEIGQISDKS